MRCVARVVHVEIDGEPTMEMHPVQGSVQGLLPIREPGTSLHPMLNQPRPDDAPAAPAPKEPLATLDEDLLDRLISGIQRL